jgi:O-6-methylguanine DNA methyltransferase
MENVVYSLLKLVPAGKVTTYGELAMASGLHPRTIGMLMRNNQDTVLIPCYRVVRSDGSLGGYSGKGGIRTKIKLLEKDGIRVENGRIDLKLHLYRLSKP